MLHLVGHFDQLFRPAASMAVGRQLAALSAASYIPSVACQHLAMSEQERTIQVQLACIAAAAVLVESLRTSRLAGSRGSEVNMTLSILQMPDRTPNLASKRRKIASFVLQVAGVPATCSSSLQKGC